MNKNDILKTFKNNLNKKTYLNPKKDLAFEIENFNIDIKPTTQKGLSFDMTTKKIKEYDKLNGLWFKSDLALYELV